MRRGVDCLTSFFEIGGHIVECDLTSLLSPYQMVSAAERPERGRIAARSQASLMPQTSTTLLSSTIGKPIVPYPFGIFHLDKFV